MKGSTLATVVMGVIGGVALTLNLVGSGAPNPALGCGVSGSPHWITNPDGTLAFLETFDGAPNSPECAYMLGGWDTQLHHRDDNAQDDTLTPSTQTEADHGLACPPPPIGSHFVTQQVDQVYNCRDHLMTAINGEAGYGAIALTPSAMLDLSGHRAVVRFDMSTFRNSSRDWIDVWVTPWADNLTVPLEDWLPDLHGPPRNSIQIRMDNEDGNKTFFRAHIFRNGSQQSLPIGRSYEDALRAAGLSPDKARRDTFELEITRDAQGSYRLKFWMPAYNYVLTEGVIGDLPFDSGIVQIAHHSYTPEKGFPVHGTASATTWHFDNVRVEPAIPFTMIHADKRIIHGSQPQTVTFDKPAPKDSWLRFTAAGDADISFDDGRTWQTALRQPNVRTGSYNSFWTPISENARRVVIRLTEEPWGYGPVARDFAFFSLSTEVLPSQTPTVTPSSPSPTNTSTPVPSSTPLPTATSTRTPTVTTSPSPTVPVMTATVPATATATAKPSPSSTAKPTATPRPERRACTIRWGNETIVNLGQRTLEECKLLTGAP